MVKDDGKSNYAFQRNAKREIAQCNTYGKHGNKMDDLCVALQLNVHWSKRFLLDTKYAPYH